MHRITVRRSAALLLAAALIAAAAVLVPAAVAGSSSNGPPQTRVYGGGNIPINSCTDGATPFCAITTREFSMLAIHDPNEDVTYGTVTHGNPEINNGVSFKGRVTCLAVSGNVAEVGGVIVYSSNPSFVGGPFNLFVRDSGQPGTVSRDGVSPIFVGTPSDPKATCRDLSSDAFGTGYFSLTYGDVAVEKP